VTFPSNFESLSLEQLNELIQEFGPVPPLVREVQIRGLQDRLKGLPRHLALMLVNPLPEKAAVEGPAREVAQFLVWNRLTDAEIGDVAQFCGDQAIRLWIRAVQLFNQDPAKQAIDAALNEVIFGAWQRRQQGEAKGGNLTGEEAKTAAEEDADSFDESLRVREFLRDNLGIEGPEDLLMWVEAMEVVHQQHKSEWPHLDLQGYNRMVRKARWFFVEARKMNSTPQAIADWRELVRSGRMRSQPNAIFRRPDGVEIFGDGIPVLRDKDGNRRRPMAGFLGEMIPAGSVPTDMELKNMARSAWPDQQFPASWTPRH
jgi:hypothetical protein